MGAFKRIYYETAVYHVISRGNNRNYILKNDEDKVSFLLTLAKYKERFRYSLYGFVLMDNHIHMIIEFVVSLCTVAIEDFSDLTGRIVVDILDKGRNY